MDNYNIQIEDNGTVFIGAIAETKKSYINSLEQIDTFAALLVSQLQQDRIKAVVYHVPEIDSYAIYQSLIEEVFIQKNEELLHRIYQNIIFLVEHHKPLIALLTKSCNNLSLATAFWTKTRYALPSIELQLADTKYGILGGFGINSIASKTINTRDSISLLVQQKSFSAVEATRCGILQETAPNLHSLVELASKSVLEAQHSFIKPQKHSIEEVPIEDIEKQLHKQRKKLPPGLWYSYEHILYAQKHSIVETLTQEKELFLSLWKDYTTVAYLRTLYFGTKEAVAKANSIGKLTDYSLQRLGVLGAGMMGAGIAFEAAKSGTTVVLKDSTLENAERGKAYAEQVSNKLMQQQRMTAAQQEQLLAHIIPTANIADLENVDLIIEAVYEDTALKAQVTTESVTYLNEHGFFASNTTSIPISFLAQAMTDASKFIGMHFFSPVDRMPLVEIIKGKFTSTATLNKAISVANKLGKVPIVVNDGPAFFTSRIFFNYLLEALTMVLEGVDAEDIEEQARVAGFAASPLAVLDEISLPLMLQVYAQLPTLHAGQQRAVTLLTDMVTNERMGRKAKAGFYNYTAGSKTIWRNPSIEAASPSAEKELIRKRLLHVVALDSYRCLETGMVEQPIDADIGSILGLGYPALSGGVISYIDSIGLPQFVEDCISFASFGEQWEVPERLQLLATEEFSFYTGLVSNWKKES